MRIVKGSWLLEMNKGGCRVERRQELPEEAFWTVQEALDKLADHHKKFLFVLSHRWLQDGHPDPHRHHLTIVCRLLDLADEGVR